MGTRTIWWRRWKKYKVGHPLTPLVCFVLCFKAYPWIMIFKANHNIFQLTRMGTRTSRTSCFDINGDQNYLVQQQWEPKLLGLTTSETRTTWFFSNGEQNYLVWQQWGLELHGFSAMGNRTIWFDENGVLFDEEDGKTYSWAPLYSPGLLFSLFWIMIFQVNQNIFHMTAMWWHKMTL